MGANDTPSRWAMVCNISASIFTTLPLVPYAFGFPTATSPKNFNLSWFSELPLFYQLASLLSAGITFSIGILVRYHYMPIMLKNLKEILGKCFTTTSDFLRNNIVLFFSLAAATAAAGLGYDGFLWTAETFAVLSAISNFLITGGFRIVFMPSLFKKIMNLFDKDYQFQCVLIELLKQLKEDYEEEFILTFHDQEINYDSVYHFMESIINKEQEFQSQLHPNSIFNQPTLTKKSLSILQKSVEVGTGTLVGISFFGFFAINGFRGLEIINNLLPISHSIKNLPAWCKLTLATLTGASSGAVGFITGQELLVLLKTIYSHIRKYPKDIPMLLGILLLCVGSATSLLGAARDTISEENVFYLKLHTLEGYLFLLGNTILSLGFDLNSLFKLLLKREELHLTKSSVIDWLNNNKLPKEMIDDLRRNSFFTYNEENNEEITLYKSQLRYV